MISQPSSSNKRLIVSKYGDGSSIGIRQTMPYTDLTAAGVQIHPQVSSSLASKVRAMHTALALGDSESRGLAYASAILSVAAGSCG